MKFFNPTARYKEMLLFEHIEENPDTTQKEIAKVIGSATSMVNLYLDEFEEKGYLKRDYRSLKVVKYNISPEGVKRKNFLSMTYFHELLKLYNIAEENINKFFVRLENKGYREVIFYGAGEVAQIMLGVIKDRKSMPFKVVGVVDDDEELIGKKVFGYKIMARDEIESVDHDAVVITSYTYEDEIMKKLEDMGYPRFRVGKFFGSKE